MEHNEAQLGVQLQTGALMMTSMMENVQETPEMERQAVLSARADGCSSKVKEQKKHAQEVTEQSTKIIAGRCLMHCSLALPAPPGINYSEPSTPTERVDPLMQTSGPAEGVGANSIDFYNSIGHTFSHR